MKIAKLLPLAALGALAFGTVAPHAQNTPQKVGFVDVKAALEAHPDYSKVADLNKKAEAELKPSRDELTAIQAKGQNATAAERQKFETLAKTYQTSAKKWEDTVNKTLQPLTQDVNEAVAVAAKSQGFTIVMDKAIAAQGLVIYADTKSTELTDAVVKQLKK